MKTNANPPTGYIVITPGPGPYDRECSAIIDSIQRALDPDETITIQPGTPGAAQAVRDLHERREGTDGSAYCDLCSNHGDITWPCATIRALDGAEK